MAAAEVALRLITKHGRTMVVVKSGTVPATPEKAWRGPANPATGGDAVRCTVKGVEVINEIKPWEPGPTSEKLRKAEKIMLIAATDPGAVGQDLHEFTTIEDGGTVWKIIGGEVIQPGETRILYQLGVVGP